MLNPGTCYSLKWLQGNGHPASRAHHQLARSGATTPHLESEMVMVAHTSLCQVLHFVSPFWCQARLMGGSRLHSGRTVVDLEADVKPEP